MTSSGRLLSGEELLHALEEPDRIFRQGSWDAAKIRGAGYSVRLACDLLVVPAAPGDSKYRAIGPEDALKEFSLAPGDSALISTLEKFSFDFNVSSTIADKFSMAAKGLLILHGGTAHPGYGRQKDYESGAWIPKDDERLYFIVVNVGPKEIYLREQDEIAYLQFFDVIPPKEPVAIQNLGFGYLSGLFKADHETEDGGLSYFREVRDLRGEVKQEMKEMRESVSDDIRQRKTELDSLRGDVQAAQTAVDRVTNASNQIVVFGVFLVGVTLLGVMVNTLIGQIEGLPAHVGDLRLGFIVGMIVLYVLACFAGVGFVAKSSWKTVFDRQTDK